MTRIHQKLVADGRRNLVQIWGPEETDSHIWTEFMVNNGGPDVFDMYTGHCYPWLGIADPGKLVTHKLRYTRGKPVSVTEVGANPESLRETHNYGTYVAKSVVSLANAGGKVIGFWRLCDQYLVDPIEKADGGDSMHNGLHKWGFWNWLPADLTPRPAYYVLSLLTRYIDRNSDVLASSADDPEVKTAVFRNSAGDYTVVVINDGAAAKSVTVNFRADLSKTLGRHLFTPSTPVTDDALLIARDSTFSANTSFTDSNVPANSVAVYTSMAPELQVKVSPNNSEVAGGSTAQLTYQIIDGSGGVTWSVIGGAGNGTVNSSGLYTAPTGLPAGTMVAVKAQSSASKSSCGLALIKIMAGHHSKK